MEDIADWLFTDVFLKCGKPTKLVFDTQFNVNEVNIVLKILAILGGKSWPYVHNSSGHFPYTRFSYTKSLPFELIECIQFKLFCHATFYALEHIV